jgi:Cytochrome C oxidase, cbb3-type, subunit III
LVLGAAAWLSAGCSGGGADRMRESEGAVLFHEAGCADCHGFVAAAARARVGPDLDIARPTEAEVARQVQLGGSGMPSFRDRLSEEEIASLASFVSGNAAGRPTTGVADAARFSPDDTRLSECKGEFSCLEQAFGNIAFRSGPKAALDELARAITVDADIEGDCHRIAHVIGAAALEHFSEQAGRALSQGSAICSSGYYHGIAERAFSGTPVEELAGAARDLCGDPSIRRTRFLAFQCVHGVGHGLMISTSYELPVALRTCDRIGTDWDRDSCAGGVFMENITSSYGLQSRWLRESDPLYPCPVVARRHKLSCYLLATSRILPLVDYDFVRASAACRRSEAEWVTTCFESLGRDASGQARGDAAGILERCAPARDRTGDCIYGAARDLVNNDAATERAQVLCNTAPRTHRVACFRGIGTIVAAMHPTIAERTRVCGEVSRVERFSSACRAGAGVAP